MKKINWGLLLLGTVLFISIGDKVIPGPVGQASANLRNNINQFLIGLVPSWKPSVNPYQRTEDALKKTEDTTHENP